MKESLVFVLLRLCAKKNVSKQRLKKPSYVNIFNYFQSITNPTDNPNQHRLTLTGASACRPWSVGRRWSPS
jgi:hypothetical protein